MQNIIWLLILNIETLFNYEPNCVEELNVDIVGYHNQVCITHNFVLCAEFMFCMFFTSISTICSLLFSYYR